MDNSGSYTISPPKRYQYFKWLRYAGILLAALYLWLTLKTYQAEGSSWETIINGGLTIGWAVIIFVYFKAPFPNSEIIISHEGIAFKENKEQQSIAWSNLQGVKMTNNSLFLEDKDGTEKELNISYSEYEQLQETKKHLRSFCEEHQITFSSKY